MQARKQKDLLNTPEQYNNEKGNVCFTPSGIARFGHIRQALLRLLDVKNTPDETKSKIARLIEIIDDLTSTSAFSRVTVPANVASLQKNLSEVFTVENGAIAFHDALLLEAANILTRNIADIQPGDLNPSKTLSFFSGTPYQTIQSTMNAISAQINFFIQLRKNAAQSEPLYELGVKIRNAEIDFNNFQFNLNHFLDLNTRPPEKVKLISILNQASDAIDVMGQCIDAYRKSECTSITIATKGRALSPMQTFELMLTNPGSLKKLTQADNLIGDTEVTPTFLTTHVPRQIQLLCKSLMKVLSQAKQHIPEMADQPERINALIENLQAVLPRLVEAFNEKTQQKNPGESLKERLEKFKTDLINDLSGYLISRENGNQGKRELALRLTTALNQIDMRELGSPQTQEDMDKRYQPIFTTESQLAQFISTVTGHYYEHNLYCDINKKSPGELGDILVKAMNDLANISENVFANDSDYYRMSLADIDEITNAMSDLLSDTKSTHRLGFRQ
jgi:hypothetical protein